MTKHLLNTQTESDMEKIRQTSGIKMGCEWINWEAMGVH